MWWQIHTPTKKETIMSRKEYQKMLKFYMFNQNLSDELASVMIKHLINKYKGVQNA